MPKQFKKWTIEELEYLHNHYNDDKESLVLYFKDRSWKSILHKINNEKLPRGNIIRRFSNEEVKLLKENYHLKKEDLMKLFPNRSWDVLRKRMDSMNLSRPKGWEYWSEEEVRILSKCKTLEEAEKALPHRKQGMIYNKARKMNIQLITYAWTDDEISILKNYYSLYNVDELQNLLPRRSKQAIYLKAFLLKLEGSDKRKDIKDDVILKYYLEEDMYCSDIAKLLNTCTQTIINRLNRINVQVRSLSYYSKSFEDRETLREIRCSLEYKFWRDAVLERDNYTCQKCMSRKCKFNVHHILNFAEHEELRVDSDNGITFCVECHKDFHKKYGYKNNTREQLNEYLDELLLVQ